MELNESFSWEGRTIACGRAGRGAPVVFCHGTPFSSRVWAPYAEALSRDFTVHLWDMPGYGASSKDPAHPVDFDVQARALAALLDHWGLDRPHVVAHDFGGGVSLRAALAHGAAYGSLMLVDVVAIPPSGSPFFRFVQEHPTVLDGLPAYIHEAVVRAYIKAATHLPVADDEVDALIAPWMGPDGQPAFYRQIAQYDVQVLVDNEAAIPTLDIPVRVAWGKRDEWVPIATGQRLADLLGVPLIPLPDAGHLAQLDAPVALMDILRTWLDQSSRSTR